MSGLHANGNQGGFTLLEVIVALSISALLVSLVYGTVRIASRSWEAGQAHIELTDTKRIGWRFLQQTLNRARHITDPHEEGHNHSLFRGDQERLTFVTEMPGHLGLGGLYLVTLETREYTDGIVLQLSHLSLAEYRESPDAESTQSAVLIDDLDSLDIAYYGAPDSQDSEQWHNSWQAAEHLPKLLRIRIRPKDQTAWPVLIAHPRTGRDRKTKVGGGSVNPANTRTAGEIVR
ncbi:MAG: prepilin-type N-terminal cleavage/methylation domain-containing protein [Sedimenticola sp.]